MLFEIDVSGSDIFEKDYTILVAEENNKGLMLGHKFSNKIIKVIGARHGQGIYRYARSKKGKTNLKIRIYCVAIYYIFKELKRRARLKKVSLKICRDFPGKEAQIMQNLKQLLGKGLKLELEMEFLKLPKDSIADSYAYLLRKDKQNKFTQYLLPIELDEFEVFLKY